MKITRTANAGVLISLDETQILIDGVCERLMPYMETPKELRQELKEVSDIVLFTHYHPDHCDKSFVEEFEKEALRSVIGPESSISIKVKNVSINPVPTRHIGKSDIEHTSFVIKGSKCIWFMGDASPSELKKLKNEDAPDVLIAPYAYFNTDSALKMAKGTGAKKLVVLHLPKREEDNLGLWESVEKTIKKDHSIIIPEMEENVEM